MGTCAVPQSMCWRRFSGAGTLSRLQFSFTATGEEVAHSMNTGARGAGSARTQRSPSPRQRQVARRASQARTHTRENFRPEHDRIESMQLCQCACVLTQARKRAAKAWTNKRVSRACGRQTSPNASKDRPSHHILRRSTFEPLSCRQFSPSESKQRAQPQRSPVSQSVATHARMARPLTSPWRSPPCAIKSL